MLDSRPPQQPTPAAAAILLIFIEYLMHWPQNCKIYQLFTSQQHSALLGSCQNQSLHSRPKPRAELEHFFRFHKTRQFGQCPSVAVLLLLLLRVCWKWTSFFMLSRVSWAGLAWAGLGWAGLESGRMSPIKSN